MKLVNYKTHRILLDQTLVIGKGVQNRIDEGQTTKQPIQTLNSNCTQNIVKKYFKNYSTETDINTTHSNYYFKKKLQAIETHIISVMFCL